MVLDDHAAKVEANASSRLCAGNLVAGAVEHSNVLQTYLRDSMTRSFLRVSVLFRIKVQSICLDDWQDQQPWRASFAAGRVDRTNWGYADSACAMGWAKTKRFHWDHAIAHKANTMWLIGSDVSP